MHRTNSGCDGVTCIVASSVGLDILSFGSNILLGLCQLCHSLRIIMVFLFGHLAVLDMLVCQPYIWVREVYLFHLMDSNSPIYIV